MRRAVEECGGSPLVTSEPKEIARADRIVLPGVGAFPDGMNNLRAEGIVDVLRERVLGGRVPFLGVCLGMQLLATTGHEGESTHGLGWMRGEVKKLQPLAGERVPHVGWNEVDLLRDSALFRGVPSGTDFYFVHSYHLACADPADQVASTPYCGGFVAVVERDNIYGVQFHLEKSQRPGFRVLRNFLAI